MSRNLDPRVVEIMARLDTLILDCAAEEVRVGGVALEILEGDSDRLDSGFMADWSAVAVRAVVLTCATSCPTDALDEMLERSRDAAVRFAEWRTTCEQDRVAERTAWMERAS